ncbi:MAG: hypothetical protein Q7U92_16720, partial [Bradyrhizobium sp.]|nr:hypothetical protein [Bradyrhizobium sp.]
GVLRLDALFTAAEFCPGAAFLEGVQNVLHVLPPAIAVRFQGVLARHRAGGKRPSGPPGPLENVTGTAAGHAYIP